MAWNDDVDVTSILADTSEISGSSLPADPTANSLAAYVASGGTALGQELPDSQSLIDLIGDFTGPHDGVAQDDNIKASLDLVNTSTDKIDGAATDGLAGTSNSLAYRVHEIEQHFHSSASWFEAAGTPTATHFADRIGTTGGGGAF